MQQITGLLLQANYRPAIWGFPKRQVLNNPILMRSQVAGLKKENDRPFYGTAIFFLNVPE